MHVGNGCNELKLNTGKWRRWRLSSIQHLPWKSWKPLNWTFNPVKRSFEAVRSSMALMQKLQIYRYNIDMYIYIWIWDKSRNSFNKKEPLAPPPRICAHPIHPIHPIYSPGRSQWWWHCPHVGHAQLPELCYPVLSLIVLNLCSINLSLMYRFHVCRELTMMLIIWLSHHGFFK